ncbi:type II secretion system protein [Candidatus Roizmanbacteria bacterium]|nr:type II secretion system protein [Candidatus Roizmanbacteria bacterium]
MKRKKILNQIGFTLMEVIVVVGIIAILTPALFAIVFGILRQQAKVQALKQAKREGDFLLQNIENNIRNYALSIHSGPPDDTNIECNSSSPPKNAYQSSPMYFKDKFGNWFKYDIAAGGSNNTKIASDSSLTNADADLTTSKVDVQGFTQTCTSTSAFSPAVVSIQFTINYNTDSVRPEDTGVLTYKTKVKLRSY